MRVHAVFAGMGTEIVVRTDRLADVRTRFETMERVASRFIADSELQRLNADPRESLPVAEDLAALFAAAAAIRELTAGLVDPAVGRAVVEWGYDRDIAAVGGLDAVPNIGGAGRWEYADGVLERDPGVVFDFGGIAKGWICDHVVEEGLASFASAGGDLRSLEPDLRVEVVDPWGEIAATVGVGVGALATSSIARRRWSVGSGMAHHLIDPRLGAPADTPVLSATVVAETALEAEAGAKAVLLRGVDGLAWADDQPWIRSAIVVWNGGSVYGTAA